jgi:hypothetical protein
MKAIRLALATAVLALSAGGCATITTGTTQAINVDSDPQGAECSLMRSGQQLATVTTPAPVTIKRNQETIHVRCKKDGFEEGLVVMNSRYETRSAGNLILGGIVGIMVDASSGASSKYDPYVMVSMAPLTPADAAAAAARPKPPPAPSPPQAEAAVAPPPPPAAPAPTPIVYGPGPWKAQTVLIADRSREGCSKYPSAYSFDLTGDRLTVDNDNGRMLVATLPTDGTINQDFRSPSGARLAVVGNARTRDLDIVNASSACRWKLVPE